MISKIRCVENKNRYNTPSFQGLGGLVLQGLQACEKNPMLNVTVLDLSTAIIPRTVIETKESNVFAGMEAFRRESSGLIVNCLSPGAIVMGLAWLLQKGLGLKGMHKVLANEETLGLIQDYMKKAEGTGAKQLENAITSFMKDLSGIDGSAKIAFEDLSPEAAKRLKNGIRKVARSAYRDKKPKSLLKKGYAEIAEATRMTEHLEHNGKVLSKNLQGILEDFAGVARGARLNGLSVSDPALYKKAVKLVNRKSLAGMAVIIPLAISMQPLNRWITSKRSGVKGAPIYKDYGNSKHVELNKKEKAKLLGQKFISIGSMLGVAFLSMGCKLPSKQMLQFKGIFPTMDQARIISTATFASRMAASEDKNELREATIRDIATFSSLYFLGDYAAKGVATLIEKVKPGVKLLNRTKTLSKDATFMQKIGHWIKDVSIKSSDEVLHNAKNWRTVCQVGNLAFSLMVLGLFIPLYNRTQTNKKREEELKQLAENMQSNWTDGYLRQVIKTSTPTFQSFFIK